MLYTIIEQQNIDKANWKAIPNQSLPSIKISMPKYKLVYSLRRENYNKFFFPPNSLFPLYIKTLGNPFFSSRKKSSPIFLWSPTPPPQWFSLNGSLLLLVPFPSQTNCKSLPQDPRIFMCCSFYLALSLFIFHFWDLFGSSQTRLIPFWVHHHFHLRGKPWVECVWQSSHGSCLRVGVSGATNIHKGWNKGVCVCCHDRGRL